MKIRYLAYALLFGAAGAVVWLGPDYAARRALPGVPASANGNTLDASRSEPLSVELLPPTDFNYKKRAEILAVRTAEVEKYPALFKKPYAPYDGVFGSIEDGRPWWGEAGLFFYGSGPDSGKGRSERSTMVLNPYLLVDCALSRAPAVDFFSLNRDKFIKASRKPGFLYFPASENLIWYPAQKRAEVSYRLNRYIRFLSRVNGAEFNVKKFEFEFRTLNARDWGFDYAYMDFGASKNMRRNVIAQEVLKTADFIHCGPSCGQDGGCNNHSPYQSALDGYSVKKLPARARFKLWRNAPANPSSPPDFTFDIKFL